MSHCRFTMTSSKAIFKWRHEYLILKVILFLPPHRYLSKKINAKASSLLQRSAWSGHSLWRHEQEIFWQCDRPLAQRCQFSHRQRKSSETSYSKQMWHNKVLLVKILAYFLSIKIQAVLLPIHMQLSQPHSTATQHHAPPIHQPRHQPMHHAMHQPMHGPAWPSTKSPNPARTQPVPNGTTW